MARVAERLSAGTRVLAVVKADAYGHGAVPVARALLGEPGLWGFGVGDSQEALELRAAGIDAPILILGTIIPEEEAQVVSHDVRVCVHSRDRIATLEEESRRQARRTRVHVMVDTGMGRLGALPARALELARNRRRQPLAGAGGPRHAHVVGKPGHPFTGVQRDRLLGLLGELRREHIEPPLVHFANTAAILGGEAGTGSAAPLVRPGISLYGVLGPDTARIAEPLGLQPVMSLRTQIVYMKDVPPGTPIGYNGTHVTARATRVATLPIGYNDGLAYRLSNRGRAIVRGALAPIIGSISMDYTMLDVGPHSRRARRRHGHAHRPRRRAQHHDPRARHADRHDSVRDLLRHRQTRAPPLRARGGRGGERRSGDGDGDGGRNAGVRSGCGRRVDRGGSGGERGAGERRARAGRSLRDAAAQGSTQGGRGRRDRRGMSRLYAVLMAGGSGTRFWPASRASRPKQLLAIGGSRPLLAATSERIAPLIPPSQQLVITSARYADAVRALLPGIPADQVIGEPEGRDTAACIGLAGGCSRGSMRTRSASRCRRITCSRRGGVSRAPARGGGGAGGAPALAARLRHRADRPATGFGYLRRGARVGSFGGREVFRLDAFVEKPDRARAEALLAQGGHLWNAGCSRSGPRRLRRLTRRTCRRSAAASTPSPPRGARPRFAAELLRHYPALTKISIDFGVMEKLHDALLLPLPLQWEDVGAWDALARMLPADAHGNVAQGDALLLDTRNTILSATGGMIAVKGVDGLIVVHTPDATLVCRRDDAEGVKAIAQALAERGLGKYA